MYLLILDAAAGVEVKEICSGVWTGKHLAAKECNSDAYQFSLVSELLTITVGAT
jgi:hypothetical protein